MHFARDVYLSDFAFRRKISTNFQIADTYQGRIYASLHKHILFHLHRTLLYTVYKSRRVTCSLMRQWRSAWGWYVHMQVHVDSEAFPIKYINSNIYILPI